MSAPDSGFTMHSPHHSERTMPEQAVSVSALCYFCPKVWVVLFLLELKLTDRVRNVYTNYSYMIQSLLLILETVGKN